MSTTDAQVLSMMRDDGPLNQVRQLFSSGCGRMEQAAAQRERPTPIESRRMEFEIAAGILAVAQRPLALLLSALLASLLDALRNAADLDGQAIYDLLADTDIIRREPYDPEAHQREGLFGYEPGEEVWVLTELGKRFAGKEG